MLALAPIWSMQLMSIRSLDPHKSSAYIRFQITGYSKIDAGLFTPGSPRIAGLLQVICHWDTVAWFVQLCLADWHPYVLQAFEECHVESNNGLQGTASDAGFWRTFPYGESQTQHVLSVWTADHQLWGIVGSTWTQMSDVVGKMAWLQPVGDLFLHFFGITCCTFGGLTIWCCSSIIIRYG